MATDIGKVGMVMKGTWNSSATYEVLDAVTYNNGLYIAKQNVPANTLPTNTTYWQAGVVEAYPETAITVTAEEGWTISTNRCTRIGDIVYIDLVLSTSSLLTARALTCRIGSNALPLSTKRFVCAAAENVGSQITKISTGFITTTGLIYIGDNGPNAREFGVLFSYRL